MLAKKINKPTTTILCEDTKKEGEVLSPVGESS